MAIFTPMSDQEIHEMRKKLIPGNYHFTILDATEKTSKKGNPYINLKLKVWDEQGEEFNVFTILSFGLSHYEAWRLKSFYKCIDLEDTYMTGNVDAFNLVSQSGFAKFGMEKDMKGEDRPCVLEYIKPEKAKKLDTLQKNEDETFDDEIPF